MFGLRSYRELVERLDGTLAGLDRTLERNNRLHDEVIAEMRDMRSQIRANTEATWRMLDRFNEGQNPA